MTADELPKKETYWFTFRQKIGEDVCSDCKQGTRTSYQLMEKGTEVLGKPLTERKCLSCVIKFEIKARETAIVERLKKIKFILRGVPTVGGELRNKTIASNEITELIKELTRKD